jgi:hypothetical protein
MADRVEPHEGESAFKSRTNELFGATAARFCFSYSIPEVQSATTSPSCVADTTGRFVVTQDRERVVISVSHDFLTAREITDVDESWKEIEEDKAKRFRSVDELLKELKG